MCRSKTLGGRRCPALSDPVKVAAYNTRRREKYAATSKSTAELENGNSQSTSPEKVTLLGKDTARYGMTGEQWEQAYKDTNAFADLIREHDKRKLEEYKTKSAAFTKEETMADEGYNSLQEAVVDYTDEGYAEIRDYVYGHYVSLHGENLVADPYNNGSSSNYVASAEKSNNLDKIMLKLDEAIALAPTPENPRTMWRGISVPSHHKQDPAKWVEETFPVGGVFSQKNYMSTTLDPVIANDRFTTPTRQDKSVFIEIVSKQGAPLMNRLSAWSDEAEILMPRNAKFKVANIITDSKLVTRGEYEIHSSPEDLPLEEIFSRVEKANADDKIHDNYIVKDSVTIIQLVDVDMEVGETN